MYSLIIIDIFLTQTPWKHTQSFKQNLSVLECSNKVQTRALILSLLNTTTALHIYKKIRKIHKAAWNCWISTEA